MNFRSLSKLLSLLAFFITVAAGCQAKEASIENVPSSEFSDLKFTPEIQNLNGYPCQKPNQADLETILKTGQWVSEQELHDHYSFTGCTVTGSVNIHGKPTKFDFDFGGVFSFPELNKSYACGKSCCSPNFSYCSFD